MLRHVHAARGGMLGVPAFPAARCPCQRHGIWPRTGLPLRAGAPHDDRPGVAHCTHAVYARTAIASVTATAVAAARLASALWCAHTRRVARAAGRLVELGSPHGGILVLDAEHWPV